MARRPVARQPGTFLNDLFGRYLRWISLRNSLRRSRDRFGLPALAIYLALALIIFGRGLARDPAGSFIGLTADPSVYMWFLVWWPHAIAHGLNPFVTDVLWAPAGFNLTWTTGIPLAGLVAAPITARFGPVVALQSALHAVSRACRVDGVSLMPPNHLTFLAVARRWIYLRLLRLYAR